MKVRERSCEKERKGLGIRKASEISGEGGYYY